MVPHKSYVVAAIRDGVNPLSSPYSRNFIYLPSKALPKLFGGRHRHPPEPKFAHLQPRLQPSTPFWSCTAAPDSPPSLRLLFSTSRSFQCPSPPLPTLPSGQCQQPLQAVNPTHDSDALLFKRVDSAPRTGLHQYHYMEAT